MNAHCVSHTCSVMHSTCVVSSTTHMRMRHTTHMWMHFTTHMWMHFTAHSVWHTVRIHMCLVDVCRMTHSYVSCWCFIWPINKTHMNAHCVSHTCGVMHFTTQSGWHTVCIHMCLVDGSYETHQHDTYECVIPHTSTRHMCMYVCEREGWRTMWADQLYVSRSTLCEQINSMWADQLYVSRSTLCEQINSMW